jgi:hypothetical protein
MGMLLRRHNLTPITTTKELSFDKGQTEKSVPVVVEEEVKEVVENKRGRKPKKY